MSELSQRAWILAEQQNFSAAEPLLRQLIADRPNDAWGHAYMAYSLTELRRWDEAIAQGRIAVQIGPTYPYAFFTLARTLILSCRYVQAIDPALEVLRLDSQDARNHWPLASALFELGLPVQALEIADRGLRVDPEQVDCLRIRSFALCGLGRFQEARDCLARSMAIRSDDPHNYNYRGWVELYACEFDAAIRAFAECLALDPMQPAAHLGIAHALARQGSLSEAEGHFKEARRLNGKFTAAGRAVTALRKWEAAQSAKRRPSGTAKHRRPRAQAKPHPLAQQRLRGSK